MPHRYTKVATSLPLPCFCQPPPPTSTCLLIHPLESRRPSYFLHVQSGPASPSTTGTPTYAVISHLRCSVSDPLQLSLPLLLSDHLQSLTDNRREPSVSFISNHLHQPSPTSDEAPTGDPTPFTRSTAIVVDHQSPMKNSSINHIGSLLPSVEQPPLVAPSTSITDNRLNHLQSPISIIYRRSIPVADQDSCSSSPLHRSTSSATQQPRPPLINYEHHLYRHRRCSRQPISCRLRQLPETE